MPEHNNFRDVAATRYGVGCHWTTWTLSPTGEGGAFEDAVERFDTRAFVDQLRDAAAGHLLLTLNHELHHVPCPSAQTDAVLPGRTCRRDLVADLLAAMRPHGIRLMLYYHHGCDHRSQDPAWQEAAGGHAADPARLYGVMERIVAELGDRYGRELIGWWFDAGYALARRGSTPWAPLADAARAGNPTRAVTFNHGIKPTEPLTLDQDYWPGELEGLDFVPTTPLAPGNLPWYTFRTWQQGMDTATWGMNAEGIARKRNIPDADGVCRVIDAYARVGGAVTFNVLVYRDGTFYPPEMALMRAVRQRARKT